MSSISSGELISDRYASALFDLASESKKVDKILQDLEYIKKCINENKEFKLLINSPLISSNEKLKIIDIISSKESFDDLTQTFFKVISNNKRFSNLPDIILKFIVINSKKRGDIQADITSADELSEGQRLEINNQLKSALGDKLSLNFKVDKKIIGGLLIKVGSRMIDSSLLSKINKLKIAMKGA